jgi:hypothetical protein
MPGMHISTVHESLFTLALSKVDTMYAYRPEAAMLPLLAPGERRFIHVTLLLMVHQVPFNFLHHFCYSRTLARPTTST